MILTTASRSSGRPGVFLAPPRPSAVLRPERLDIAGFVGVALRGPVDEPVRIGRWSDFERLFGGFEPTPGGPVRLLPYAVSTFFRQGGQVAYVLRVAPHAQDGEASQTAAAQYRLTLPVSGDKAALRAANEGPWGNQLRVQLLYRVEQRLRADVAGEGILRLPPGMTAPAGSLLRLSHPDLPGGAALRWVTWVDDRLPRGSPVPVRLDDELPLAAGVVIGVEVVTGAVRIDDLSRPGTGEFLPSLGLRPAHPRWIQTVLAGGTRAGPEEGGSVDRHLVIPDGDWTGLDFTPGIDLAPPKSRSGERLPLEAELTGAASDRSHLIDRGAFFDPGPIELRGIDEETRPDEPDPHVGVDRMARVAEIGLLCVPDLAWAPYEPAPAFPVRHPQTPFPCRCRACSDAEPEREYHAVKSPAGGLDTAKEAELAELVARQERVVELARANERFIALLDVPSGFSVGQVSEWRSHFDCSYAAAYHPWLAVTGDEQRGGVPVPPSAFAAGIIAERELRLGLPWGPANELARGAVRMEAAVTDAAHDRLHELGVNVYRAERDGFRLTAARTLSSDPDYRQLSVRRLMTMLRLTLQRQCADLAFEPNTAELRERLRRTVTALLRDLTRRGAFAGRTEAESYFVHCRDDVNPPSSQAMGRLIAEIGVAPAVPLEYILVRIARDPDGALTVARDEQ